MGKTGKPEAETAKDEEWLERFDRLFMGANNLAKRRDGVADALTRMVNGYHEIGSREPRDGSFERGYLEAMRDVVRLLEEVEAEQADYLKAVIDCWKVDANGAG